MGSAINRHFESWWSGLTFQMFSSHASAPIRRQRGINIRMIELKAHEKPATNSTPNCASAMRRSFRSPATADNRVCCLPGHQPSSPRVLRDHRNRVQTLEIIHRTRKRNSPQAHSMWAGDIAMNARVGSFNEVLRISPSDVEFVHKTQSWQSPLPFQSTGRQNCVSTI
jgi:hypothetical protein